MSRYTSQKSSTVRKPIPTAVHTVTGRRFSVGGTVKRVTDPQLTEVVVYRYRCCRCRRTFRHYPPGMDRACQTARMRALAAIGWLLGMRYPGSSTYLSRMSIWRDAEELARERLWKPVRVLSVDGAYVRGWGKTQPARVALDGGGHSFLKNEKNFTRAFHASALLARR